MNLVTHRGVGTLFENESPWLIAVYCFNHQVELAAKDAFENPFFEDINQILAFLVLIPERLGKRWRK